MSGPRVMVLAAALLVAAGCRTRDADPAPAMPPPVAEAEVMRGKAACQDYIEKVCACAEARPDDAEVGALCDMSGAKLSSLVMVMQVNQSPADAKERAATSATMRKIIRSCIEGTSDLVKRGCSLSPPGDSPGSPPEGDSSVSPPGPRPPA